ncbi:hypothetical protein [Paraburkholderia acidisoli]|uniref:Uncharacterized protein n=1 Tax=Paraburkholderia acidisoli TaxID=2571748 RepID=A0A7Z2GHH1_9BURK|nr:hypothetical protein [Paraburkholderia acidisoli]QGZ61887.1 hypothetical protein FAZ98_09165 [Paraburkholderia acidisoli]
MPRTRPTPTATVPGAGTLFALRAIGLVMLARWLHSMGQMNFFAALESMASSPAACLNLVFLFLLIVLPGAKARVERPYHPLPQWLRQALRFLGLLGFLFAIGSIGMFVWAAGWRRTVMAIAETNGWLVAAPALYLAVVWICRPRALWRTNIAARRFAIGRFAVSIDAATRTTVVWQESRKLGQYDARELAVRWLAGAPQGGAAVAPLPALLPAPVSAVSSHGEAYGVSSSGVASPGVASPGVASPVHDAETPAVETPAVEIHHAPEVMPVASPDHAESAGASPTANPAATTAPARAVPPAAPTPAPQRSRWPKIELLWDSPAAAGHNRQTVFRVGLRSENDRLAARALDTALRQA